MQIMAELGKAAVINAKRNVSHLPPRYATLKDPEKYEPRAANEVQLWKMQAAFFKQKENPKNLTNTFLEITQNQKSNFHWNEMGR